MRSERWRRSAVLLCLLLAAGCATLRPGSVNPELKAVAQRNDALVTADALEALIERDADSPADREFAYEAIQTPEEDTAAYAFARATVTGRLVQQPRPAGREPGGRGGELGDAQPRARSGFPRRSGDPAARHALRDRARHPPRARRFRAGARAARGAGGAATRTCPRTSCGWRRPTSRSAIRSRPRRTCARRLAQRNALRRDDQQLLDHLVATAGTPDCANPG